MRKMFVQFIYVFSLCLLVRSLNVEVCPGAEWLKFEKKCYLIVDQGQNWVEGRESCQAEGGDLTTITTQEIWDFLIQRLDSNTRYWMGMRDENFVDGNMTTWITGDPVIFEQWALGEPNDGRGNEDCGEIYFETKDLTTPKYVWNDVNCAVTSRHPICSSPVDVDECESGTDNCDMFAACTNLPETFSCSCFTGYAGNGTFCTEINECSANLDNCDVNAQCTNTNGSFTCACNAGWSGDGVRCVVDFCANVSCGEKATCSNQPGYGTCTCNDGYRGDPYTLCEPFCKQQTFVLSNNTLVFPDTWKGQFAYSIERCDNGAGRPVASVICSGSQFNREDITIVDCLETPANFLDNLDATNTSLEEVAGVLQVLTSNGISSADDTRRIVGFLNDTTERATEISSVSYVNLVQVFSEVTLSLNQFEGNNTRENITESLLPTIEQLSTVTVLTENVSSLLFETGTLQAEIQKPVSSSSAGVSKNVVTHLQDSLNIERVASYSIPADAFRQATEDKGASGQFFTIYYKDTALFLSGKNATQPLSISFGRNVTLNSLKEPLKIKYDSLNFNHRKVPLNDGTLLARETVIECVFWDFSINEWSPEGCLLEYRQDVPVCQCQHLTNFALLVSSSTVLKDIVLDVVSDVGCILSAIAVALTFIVYISDPDLRNSKNSHILHNVCINLMISYIIFLAGIEQTSHRAACIAVTALLQFFLLTSWCWMSVYSFDMYLSFVKVFRFDDRSKFLTLSYAFAYGIPLVTTIFNVGIAVGHVDAQQPRLTVGEDPLAKSSYRSDYMCWLGGYSLYFGFLLPFGILLLANLVFFAMLQKNVVLKKKQPSSSKKLKKRQRLAISVTLFTTMGIAWVFGFIMLISRSPQFLLAMSWVFAIATTTQGVFIFLMSAVRPENIRKKWISLISNLIPRRARLVSLSSSEAATAQSTLPPNSATS